MATKKVGSAGRFSARYGRKIRANITEIEKRQKQKQRCPNCRRLTIKRLASGIYFCKKCNLKITGKAYTLE